jgi:hypothetical protein
LRTLRLLTSLRALLLLALMLRISRRCLPPGSLLGDRRRGGDREQQREQRSG